jgi:hypothetical protein
MASTVVYASGGWTAVCVLGAGISLLALLFWAAGASSGPAIASPATAVTANDQA